MKSPAKENLTDGNILEVLTLAGLWHICKAFCKKETLHEAPFFNNKGFNHKESVSVDCHQEYMCKIPSHLVKRIRSIRSRQTNLSCFQI